MRKPIRRRKGDDYNIPANLAECLIHTGLTLTPCFTEFIGRTFLFTAERGSHFFQLVGTIVAFNHSDKGGLKLFVSNPEIWGKPLKYISFHRSEKNQWAAVMDDVPRELSDKEAEKMTEEEQIRFLQDAMDDLVIRGSLQLL